MTASFYLFDVDHGQCAALKLPNGKWCVFDAGCTASFSPINWIASRHPQITPRSLLGMASAIPQPIAGVNSLLGGMGNARAGGLLGLAAAAPPQTFSIYKATISHFHGDHIDDYETLLRYSPSFMRTVNGIDQEYLQDCYSTCSDRSRPKVSGFVNSYSSSFSGTHRADYGEVSILELSLPANIARSVGGSANSRVNNASVVTRIDAYGNAILICGDLEKEAWDAIIADTGEYGQQWRPLLTNIDILVAPHHGHVSGYSTQLLNLAGPSVVLTSVVTKDPNVDSRYSQAPVRGITIDNSPYSCITTRTKGHIKIDIARPEGALPIGKGMRTWSFGVDALS